MAPFRGRGGSRGSSRGGPRGGSRGASRGSSRGGQRGGSRGGNRGRGAPARGSGKVARSGIRTRGGYKKFDSQRVKDVGASASEGELPEVESEPEEEGELSEDDDEELVPTVKAYNALMQSFQQPANEDGRKRKRRRIEVEEPAESPDGSLNGLEADDGAEEIASDADEDDADEEVAQKGDADVGEGAPDEDDEDASDPYTAHFADIEDNELSRRLKAIQANEWRTEKQSVLAVGSCTVSAPKPTPGTIIRKPTILSPADLSLKKRLADASRKHLPAFDETQQAIAPYIFNYMDMLAGNRTPQNAEQLRSVACLHALNHILKGRDKVLKNTARLSQSENPETLDLRDQGFTRPKVLILTETRQMAYNYGEHIVDLFQPEQQENKQRFKDSFTAPVDDRDIMPEDYSELFDGNNDNSFLTGLKFTRKTLKFFSAFYSSDIILASPLGLRRIIENEDVKKRDHDFLSSIELVIVDQADAMQMQNWENVEVVFKHLNLQPRETHGTDFNRVRSWYLDGNAKYLRQMIVFSAYITPEMNRLFNTSMLNVSGKAKLSPNYEGTITASTVAGLGIKQTFSRFDSASPDLDPDARFKYFTTALLPSLLRLPKPADGAQGILVFIPSYFDFLRLRNFFATSTLTQNISFGAIHDYSEVSDQRRARSHFLSGRHSILLYTQRAHHFFRLRLKGGKRVVLYGVPDNGIFYEELVGGMVGTSVGEGRVSPEEASVRALFSKWDGLRMERVVGSGRVKGMLGGVGDTFDFV
ncbi:hypothetical protein LTR85_006891 [Meristemomyces frigidus]|nr:hypothetical protein LTR85_006891 [Meristemomyces frigidus]